MPTTTNYAFPYPASTDSPDGPTQFQNLATAIDSRILTVSNTLSALNTTATNNRLTVAFMRATGTQTFATIGTFYAVLLNTEDIDTDDGHSNVSNTSRWTCPSGRQGKYLVQGGYGSSPNAYTEAFIYKNGSVVAGSGARVTPNGATLHCETPLVFVSLNAGDYVELYARCGMTNSVTDNSFWPAHLLVLRLPD